MDRRRAGRGRAWPRDRRQTGLDEPASDGYSMSGWRTGRRDTIPNRSARLRSVIRIVTPAIARRHGPTISIASDQGEHSAAVATPSPVRMIRRKRDSFFIASRRPHGSRPPPPSDDQESRRDAGKQTVRVFAQQPTARAMTSCDTCAHERGSALNPAASTRDAAQRELVVHGVILRHDRQKRQVRHDPGDDNRRQRPPAVTARAEVHQPHRRSGRRRRACSSRSRATEEPCPAEEHEPRRAAALEEPVQGEQHQRDPVGREHLQVPELGQPVRREAHARPARIAASSRRVRNTTSRYAANADKRPCQKEARL